MTMADNLTSLTARSRKTKPEYHVVNTTFQKLQQVFTGNALHLLGLVIIAAELLFHDAVNEFRFLLLFQLKSVLADLAIRTLRLTLRFL